MGGDAASSRPVVVEGGLPDAPTDPRVVAVLDVLAGRSPSEVAQRWSVDVAVLSRWVRSFVDAGTAQVTNRPDGEVAHSRDRFLAAFADELRTPLTVAQGWVALLRDEDVPPESVAQSVGQLHTALERLAERIEDVELLAAASLGRLTLRPRSVTVGELAEGIPRLDGVAGEGADVRLRVDPDLFHRVLRDIWKAARVAPSPRHVRLEAHRVDPWVELRVVRDADPIDPQVLHALFEPFDLNHDGTGVTIGLYLARALTVAHGGTLGVEQDDHGAVLWVRVPAPMDDRTTVNPTDEEIR